MKQQTETTNFFSILNQMEYELKTIWQQAQASQGDQKDKLLKQYRAKHIQYKDVKYRLFS